jgi:methionine-rich copper-binding protein CopC
MRTTSPWWTRRRIRSSRPSPVPLPGTADELALWPLAHGARSGPSASARPALVRAVPVSGAALAQGPSQVALTFAAPLDPRRSSIVVVDDSMTVLNDPALTTVSGPHRTDLRTRLHRRLRPGPYTVAWTAATPGGPFVRQAYLFTVGPPQPPILPDRPVSLVHRAGPLTIRLTAPSDRVAHQSYTITLSAGGRPVSGAQVHLVGRALEMDMGEVLAVARAVAPGRYVAVADVVMASDWQVVVTVQRGRVVTHTAFSYFAHY